MSLFIKNIFLVQLCLILAILYPTSLANLVVEVGTRDSHQTLLKEPEPEGLIILVLKPQCSGITRSIPWLMMPGFLHHQAISNHDIIYICRKNSCLSSQFWEKMKKANIFLFPDWNSAPVNIVTLRTHLDRVFSFCRHFSNFRSLVYWESTALFDNLSQWSNRKFSTILKSGGHKNENNKHENISDSRPSHAEMYGKTFVELNLCYETKFNQWSFHITVKPLIWDAP